MVPPQLSSALLLLPTSHSLLPTHYFPLPTYYSQLTTYPFLLIPRIRIPLTREVDRRESACD
ncbi:MAG: hypothetical protein E8D46_04540 [Nitrospira sp.]|nr:MAG: hypothetical protein E8D46_04540 [Nitrospira sp.]